MRLCLRSTVLQGAGLGSGGARQGLLGQQDLQFLPEEPGLSSVDSRGTEVFFSRVGQGQSTGCSLEEWRPAGGEERHLANSPFSPAPLESWVSG